MWARHIFGRGGGREGEELRPAKVNESHTQFSQSATFPRMLKTLLSI